MKTRIRIFAMLLSMMIGTLAVSAQTARRGETQKRGTTTSKTYKRTQSSNSTARSKAQEPDSRRTVHQSRSAQNGNSGTVQRKIARPDALQGRTSTQNRAASQTRKPQTQKQTTYQKPGEQRSRQVGPKTSTSNQFNSRSNYRKPNSTVHVGKTYSDPKNRGQLNQNTHSSTHIAKPVTTTYHSHNYYPHKRVKIHVHPHTYQGNYRALYYPGHTEIIWTRSMHRNYIKLYPYYTGWHYSFGYRIQTISVFDARYNVGEIARVYGRVYATWYNKESDDLLLFFGGEYPNQEFTMVIPGNIARRYSWRPERYFLGQHIAATGLISSFEGRAEMIVKRRSQLDIF